eukprot:SAG31_NODE_2449_length_5669_cov_3.744345_5_plen_85_part_00
MPHRHRASRSCSIALTAAALHRGARQVWIGVVWDKAGRGKNDGETGGVRSVSFDSICCHAPVIRVFTLAGFADTSAAPHAAPRF